MLVLGSVNLLRNNAAIGIWQVRLRGRKFRLMVRGAFLVVGQDGLFLVGNLKNQELRGRTKAQRVAVVNSHGRARLCRFAAQHGLYHVNAFVGTRKQRGAVSRSKPLGKPSIAVLENAQVFTRYIDVHVVDTVLACGKKPDKRTFFAGGKRVHRRTRDAVVDADKSQTA